MIQQADTVGGVSDRIPSAIEHAASAEPKEFYDLVIEVAIVRPVPSRGNMVHPYLRRVAAKRPVEYPSGRRTRRY